jgi:CheY-like chemotaxis protein
VRDDGIGIDAEKLPHVFDMFAQAGQPQSPLPGGLGIGLSLVKRLVELHGGRVDARSAGPGHGSEFTVVLPRHRQSVQVAAPCARAEPASIDSTARVLVVDDNRDAADSLAMVLQLNGNDVRAVYTGEDCISTAQSFKPEIIILDIGLPGLSGHEVGREIRAAEWGQDILLVALTGWGQESDRQMSAAAGFDHHLVKPVSPDELMELLAGASSTSVRRT